jgi:hypothetical protein
MLKLVLVSKINACKLCCSNYGQYAWITNSESELLSLDLLTGHAQLRDDLLKDGKMGFEVSGLTIGGAQHDNLCITSAGRVVVVKPRVKKCQIK